MMTNLLRIHNANGKHIEIHRRYNFLCDPQTIRSWILLNKYCIDGLIILKRVLSYHHHHHRQRRNILRKTISDNQLVHKRYLLCARLSWCCFDYFDNKDIMCDALNPVLILTVWAIIMSSMVLLQWLPRQRLQYFVFILIASTGTQQLLS